MFVVGFNFAKISCPLVKMIDSKILQHSCLQVTHKGVKLGHRIADGCAYNHKVSIQTNADFTLYKNVEITAPIDSTINMYADLSKSDLVRSENTQSASANDSYHTSLYLCVFIAYAIG